MAIDTSSKSTETKQGKGFASPQPKNPSQSDGGTSQAIALATGLESTLLAQAGSLGELAHKTDVAADAIAAPIVEFCSSVVNGDLLMSKIAEGLNNAKVGSLQASVHVDAPTLPALPQAKVTNDFFAKPGRIAIEGS